MRRNAPQRVDEIPNQKLAAVHFEGIAEKSGWPTMAAISGVSRSLTRAVTTPPKAAPMTTATAKSRTFPRKMNC